MAEIPTSENVSLETAVQYGLSAEEFARFCKALGRNPSIEEVAVCGALWSEHCSYKSSKVHLRRLHTEEPWVVQGPGENAGVVSINGSWGIAFKMESHNHPSYIEPYQGAATGVGGILRDVFCMGARPIANLNCLRFGEGSRTAKLMDGCVRGIGDYGNSVGVPTVAGQTGFHAGYSKNILVNAFTAGLIHKNKIFKGVMGEEGTGSSQKSVLIYFGSATGRDGVHGATMSSAEFSAHGENLKPTVQVGDPFAEKVLLEATLALIESGLALGLQDMGAAGLTSSSVEMAGRSGCGVTVNLDSVPKRARNLKAVEILLSESQERMLCAVLPDRVSQVLELLARFDLPAAVIGQVNDTGNFICEYEGRRCTEIPVHLLVEDIPKYELPLQDRATYLENHRTLKNEGRWIPEAQQADLDIRSGSSLKSWLQSHAAHMRTIFTLPEYASKFPLVSHYCGTVQGNTIAGCGAFHEASAAIVRLPREAQENEAAVHAIAVVAGCEERWVELDPRLGTALSMLKLARKIVAAGGVPLAITDCLNFGSLRAPAVARQFSDAVDGMNDVAKAMHIPVVSGNVSLNNQTDGKAIPPTPMLGMVGNIADLSKISFSALPQNLKKNLTLIHLAENSPQQCYGSSSVAWYFGGTNAQELPVPDFSAERLLWNAIGELRNISNPILCLPAGRGGAFASLLECAFRSEMNIAFSESFLQRKASEVFCEGRAEFLFGVEAAQVSAVLDFFRQKNFGAEAVATLTSSGTDEWHSARAEWRHGLSAVFR